MFACIGKAFCYLLLFLGWQTVVSMACTYSALFELEGREIAVSLYREGLGLAALAFAGLGLLFLAVWAIVGRVRKRSLRRMLGLRENAGTGTVALAAAGTVVGTMGSMALLGRMAWQTYVGLLHLITVAMDGSMPDLMVVYDAALEKTAEISAVSGVLTLASLALFFRLRGRKPGEEVWLRPVSGPTAGWSAALAFCLYWAVSLLFAFLPEAWMADYTEASASLNNTGVLMFVATAFVAPVVEEVIFRGLIYTRLQRAIHPLAAVVGAAFLFGYCHGDLVWFLYAFILGFLFAQLTRDTGSILPALVMHVVFNLTNEVLTLVDLWIPDAVYAVAVFLFGLAGTIFCAIRLRRALESARCTGTVSQPVEEDLPPVPAPPPAAPETDWQAPARPERAAWDPDSGPDHKFPPQRR